MTETKANTSLVLQANPDADELEIAADWFCDLGQDRIAEMVRTPLSENLDFLIFVLGLTKFKAAATELKIRRWKNINAIFLIRKFTGSFGIPVEMLQDNSNFSSSLAAAAERLHRRREEHIFSLLNPSHSSETASGTNGTGDTSGHARVQSSAPE